MYPLIIVLASFALAGFMGWLAQNLSQKQQIFKFFYFCLMLMFLVYGAYQVTLLGYSPEVRLNYTTEICFETNATACLNKTITYTYGNYTSGYANYGDSFLSIAYVLGIITFLFLMYMLVTYMASIMEKAKGDKGGRLDLNEYEQPY